MSASPQLSKPTAQPAKQERRRHARSSIVDDQIIAVTLDGDNGGLVLDLAEDGMAVQAVAPLQKGKSTEIAFKLPDSKGSIRAHGEVRWAEPSGRAGIRLVAFSEGSSAAIRAAFQPAPAAPATAAPEASKPAPPAAVVLDAAALEREITVRKLHREPALGFLAERIGELPAISGAAIALGSSQEMICCASAGAAPGVGVRLQNNSGLSGECVRTGHLVRSDDTEDDRRVDAAVCRQLGLRSALLLPIRDGGEMRGVLEVFSSRPRNFTDDHIRRLEQVAALVARITHEPAQPKADAKSEAPVVATTTAAPAPNPVPPPAMETQALETPYVEATPPPSFLAQAPPSAKYALVVCAAAVLGVGGWGVLHRRTPATNPATVQPAPAAVPVPGPVVAAPEPAPQPAVAAPAKQESPTPAAERKVEAAKPAKAPEALAIRPLPSAPVQETAEDAAPPTLAAPAGSMPNLAAPRVIPTRPGQIAPGVVPGRLVHRVEPVYPDVARRTHAGGSVVLNAVIRADGKVGSVEVVSGNPLLARAALDAVKQWRYEPFTLHGVPVEAEATIRLNFHP